MKKILLFLSLLVFDVYAFAKAYTQICLQRVVGFIAYLERVSPDSIIPVKSGRFNEKIYIFERYGIWVMSPTSLGKPQFVCDEVVQKPIVLQKWIP